MLLICCAGLMQGCSKGKNGSDGGGDGYVTGVAKDRSGNPLPGVTIIIDHSIFYNSNITTQTGPDGQYRVKVRTGSWYAFAQYQKSYNGRTYSFYLAPDNAAGFGGEGAERNFEWKLTGRMPQPLNGIFGGLVTLDNLPGVYVEEEKMQFTFTPQGSLIDGSAGEVLRMSPDSDGLLPEIPIGKYVVTAKYEGRIVTFRKWNTDGAFIASYELNFEPQIPAQCDNCAKLEYLVDAY